MDLSTDIGIYGIESNMTNIYFLKIYKIIDAKSDLNEGEYIII